MARRAGVGIDALRFYERERLLPSPEREPSSGYRVYSLDTVRTVRFIREAQDLGFTLKEVAELLRLRDDATATCREVREAARTKLEDVERRIRKLQSMRRALRSLIESCRSEGGTRSCTILDALDDGAPHAATR